MSDEPTFEMLQRPERRYSRHAGFEYAGGTVFSLSPMADRLDADATESTASDLTDGVAGDPVLDGVLTDVLSGDPYTYGDWFDLPMVLYLVHDADTGDVFRVAVRDGAIELHALPSTEPPGFRGFYRRLRSVSGVEWRVDRRASPE